MPYKVIDNFLAEEDFTKIKDAILFGDFPWYFSTYIADETDGSDKYFVHTFFAENNINSNYFQLLTPILNKLTPNAIVRAKANLFMGNKDLIEHEKHTDFDFVHKGFILYLNSNDGFTRLADGVKVNSVANRALFFEPNTLHNSTNCTDAKFRANVTINYF